MLAFTWKIIGETLNISPRSLYRLRKEAKVNDPLFESSIGDEELCNVIREYLGENVRRGEKMVQGLLTALGNRVSRQRIRDCMGALDPVGNDIRRIGRLKRRTYEVPGSHFLWHLDGCHKLIKFGFVIHTCIDGFSRYLIYSVCRDNNRANTVSNAFKEGSKNIRYRFHSKKSLGSATAI